MTTREDLRELCRRRLSDNTDLVHWSDEKINQWINDAIADYSNYFPYKRTYTLSLTVDVYKYDLTSDLVHPREILSVEYPLSQDPVSYLTRRSERDSRGFYGGYYYDVIGSPPTDIIIAPNDWGVGASADLTYLADHTYLDDDSDVATVPDLHLELIVLFVRLAAIQEQTMLETQNPSTTDYILGTLALNVNRAEREYRTKLYEYRESFEPGSQVVGWEMDEWDRVY